MNRPPFSAALKHLIHLGTYLMIRLEADPATVHLAPTVAATIMDLKKHGEAVEAAVREESLKKGDLKLARDRWHTQYVRTHGLLVGLYGSTARADRFFKSFHAFRTAAETGDGDGDAWDPITQ